MGHMPEGVGWCRKSSTVQHLLDEAQATLVKCKGKDDERILPLQHAGLPLQDLQKYITNSKQYKPRNRLNRN